MQIAFHTTMRTHIFTTLLVAFLYSLITPTVWAEINTVPLRLIEPGSSLQKSSGMRISPASLAVMMQQMRYKKESLFGDIFSSGESKIDNIFGSDKSIEVFSSSEVQALSAEISAIANTLKPRQAIAFKSEMGRVKGYVFFSGQQSIWHFASIEGRPAHETKKLEDESYMPDDPESDLRWQNRVEKSYWHLKPQQNQSLYQERPDWLRVPVKHIFTVQPEKMATPQKAAPPSSVHKGAPAVPTSTTADAKRGLRIERLQKLLNSGLISSSEYDEKIVIIITKYNQSHPAIEDQFDFLKRLRDNNRISQAIYQSHRQELMEKL
jgi:hypothetical protein